VVELKVHESSKTPEDYVAVRRPVLKPLTPTDTEEVGVLPVGGCEDFFFFPNLAFPEGMVLGRSARILEVYQQLDAVARSSAAVLLVGKPGQERRCSPAPSTSPATLSRTFCGRQLRRPAPGTAGIGTLRDREARGHQRG